MYTEQSTIDYQRIEKAIQFMKERQDLHPTLEELAAYVHLSPSQFQRLFTSWAVISPKKFMKYLTVEYARGILDKNRSLAGLAHQAKLSGPGRLQDLCISLEGRPLEHYRKSGSGLTIYAGFHHSPFGKYLLAVTAESKICSLQFISDEEKGLSELKRQWSSARHVLNQEKTGPIARSLFNPDAADQVKLFLRGTPFQLTVWEALLKIPVGELVSYQAVAQYVNKPSGFQAVGSAIGKNPVAYLVPCHRVIKKDGQISEYRWGSIRKSAMVGWEASGMK